jgi:hypothetical protein
MTRWRSYEDVQPEAYPLEIWIVAAVSWCGLFEIMFLVVNRELYFLF